MQSSLYVHSSLKNHVTQVQDSDTDEEIKTVLVAMRFKVRRRGNTEQLVPLVSKIVNEIHFDQMYKAERSIAVVQVKSPKSLDRCNHYLCGDRSTPW